MSLSRQDVAKVGLLSRLALSDADLDALTGELSKIVGFVSQLAEVDTSRVEPLAHPLDAANVFRADDLRDAGRGLVARAQRVLHAYR
jgi:aspartyl-tRNA(Asn)/glutamyl-tRNA(Gln) amidotransferase subunit C